MIKAKVVSFTLSRTNGSLSKLELETYLEDQVDINSFYMGGDFDGLDAVIMTEEEYKSLEEVNKALDSVSNVLRQSLLEEREKTRKLEERLAQDAAEVDIHPDGTIVVKKKRVSELEKKVKKLEEENKALKEDKFTMKITGGLFYQKED